ncbi:formate dehydrogenase subunit gamma [Enterovirga sp. DB1703]|uniref:Formate dehydrogenase subunit gamma n=2 Tax=Enterovirga aerilata TaxID=2730920 RepID=A0A849IFT5_9HYPH|nr:formate dehydrogenase subunit gamma [Enterovirga sp. DB1703]
MLGGGAAVLAQTGRDVPPAASTANPSGQNPTAASVREDQLLRELNKLQGRVSIPDGKAALLEQPQGREWRQFREGWLPWIGGIAILGMLLALFGFYFTKGRIRLDQTEESGVKILRFNAFERFMHWLTAVCFIVLALTGLNYIFGKRLLMPIIGPDAFAALSQWGKYAHNYLAWPFMLGLLLMLIVWVKDNIPNRVDVAWIRKGGGFLGDAHPSAYRFNAGQKMIFWIVVIGGLLMSATGILMLFPFSATDINGMQLTQAVHAVIGVLFIAAILAHIYIGSLGMEGAYDAMGSGEVDLAWARRHHDLWVEEQRAKTASGPQVHGARPVPAE